MSKRRIVPPFCRRERKKENNGKNKKETSRRKDGGNKLISLGVQITEFFSDMEGDISSHKKVALILKLLGLCQFPHDKNQITHTKKMVTLLR